MGRLYAYCRECGAPQGDFKDLMELRLNITKQRRCNSCGVSFNFLTDGRIWNLWWEELEENVSQQEKVYEKGGAYDIYKDLKDIFQSANTEIFLIDSWVNEEIIELYLDKIKNGVSIKLLTHKPQGNFITVAKKFKNKPNIKFEVRQSSDCHDRLIFIDNDCYLSGQSLKNAGDKPTYLELTRDSKIYRKIWDNLWATSKIII